VFDVEVEHFKEGRRAAAEVLRVATRSAIAGQEPRLHAFGQRFRAGGVVPELAEVRRRFVTDGREAPSGVFTLVRFRPDDRLARVIERVDPSALEGRLVRAAQDTLRDRLGWAQGVLHVSYGRGPDRGGAEVLALLSARRSDGGPARLLGPVDIQGLEASWFARSHDAVGLTRELPVLDRAARGRLDVWRDANQDLRRAWSDRLRGAEPPAIVRSAFASSDDARRQWVGERRSPLVDDASNLRALRLSVERGGRYLAPLDARERGEALQLAVERVGREIGIPKMNVAHWERSETRDLRLLVSYNQAEGGIDRAAVGRALTERLGGAIEDEVSRYARWTPREPPGRVSLEPDVPARDASVASRPPRAEGRVSLDGRPVVRFRLEGGARNLEAFPKERQVEILERAARRAFPGGWTDGARPQLDSRVDGRAAIVRVYLPPESAGRWPDLLPAPDAQARFTNEVYRAGSELRGLSKDAGTVVLPVKLPGPDRAVTTGAAARGIAASGSRGLNLERLSTAVPGAFRLARGVSRLVGSLLPARED
jgi:hypothetical protein